MVEETPPQSNDPDSAKGPRPKLKKKKMRPKAAATHKPTFIRIIENFSACARCSFFLTGYRALFLDEQVEQQINQSDTTWLNLNWTNQVASLLHHSFGREITSDLLNYQLCCPDCMRLYAYEQKDESAAIFRVQIDPQKH
jgi:hypothetical protein